MLAQTVAPPDVVLLVTGYLRDLLAGRPETYAQGVLVAGSVPSPRRDRMVVVEDDGGNRLPGRVLFAQRVRLQVWGAKPQEARNLALLAYGLMLALPGTGGVLSVPAASGPFSVADPSGQPKMFATFELVVRGNPFTP